MAGKPAILSVRILSHANSRGFNQAMRNTRKLERQVARTAASMQAFDRAARKIGLITAAAAVASGAVGLLAIGIVGVGALAAPALAPVLLGLDGIKQAAGAASGPFNDLKAAVSGVFATELVPGFESLGRTLTALTPALTSMAGTLSQGFNAAAAGIEANAGAISQIITASQSFLVGMGPGLTQLGQGLLDLAMSASTYAGQIGAGVGALLGSIGDAFTRLQGLGALDTIFANLGPVLASIGGLLSQVLVTFGQLAAVIAPVLAPLFDQLSAAIAALTPALMTIAQAAGPALLQTFTALVPALGPLSEALAGILVAVLPLVPAFAQIIATLATGLAPVLAEMTPTITVLAQILAAVLVPVAGVLAGVLQVIAPILPAIVAGFAAYVAVSKALAIAQGIMIAKQIALNAAMLLNPIGLVVAAIVALVAGIVIAYNKVDWFRNAVNALGRGFMWVVDKIRSLISWVGRIRWPKPPGWLSKMFTDGGGDLFTVPPETLQASMRIVPVHNLDLAAATGPNYSGLGALMAAGSGSSTPAPTYVNHITVNGALDPQAVADQISGLLDTTPRARGALMAGTMGGRR